jgi:mono/diheme cytochrome c family protein
MRKRIVRVGGALLGGGILLAAAAVAAFALARSPVVFASLESKTSLGEPIYNRVALIPGWKKDLWVMQQSHRGPTPDFHRWDRLAIEVDRTRSPAVARFLQLDPGAMALDGSEPARPFRVACFMCHANGPRAIRPDLESKQAALSLGERIAVGIWNWRVRSYGRVVPADVHRQPAAVPFRNGDAFANEPLTLAACARCHNDKPSGRGYLARQHATTILFMVGHGLMPPPGRAMDAGDRADLDRFLTALPTAVGHTVASLKDP